LTISSREGEKLKRRSSYSLKEKKKNLIIMIIIVVVIVIIIIIIIIKRLTIRNKSDIPLDRFLDFLFRLLGKSPITQIIFNAAASPNSAPRRPSPLPSPGI
jgi:flagellar basal body-associated protein FliL